MQPNQTITLRTVLMICAFLATQSHLHAAYPVIHVQWDGGGTPVENTHYRIETDSPASPDFPDVELIAGHLDWRVWSTDTDNEDDIGDIGTISCPHADNFAVTILDDSGGVGARDVKAITLVPSSSSNYDPNSITVQSRSL